MSMASVFRWSRSLPKPHLLTPLTPPPPPPPPGAPPPGPLPDWGRRPGGGPPDETMIRASCADEHGERLRMIALGDLRHTIATITSGQKLAYVTDTLYSG